MFSSFLFAFLACTAALATIVNVELFKSAYNRVLSVGDEKATMVTGILRELTLAGRDKNYVQVLHSARRLDLISKVKLADLLQAHILFSKYPIVDEKLAEFFELYNVDLVFENTTVLIPGLKEEIDSLIGKVVSSHANAQQDMAQYGINLMRAFGACPDDIFNTYSALQKAIHCAESKATSVDMTVRSSQLIKFDEYSFILENLLRKNTCKGPFTSNMWPRDFLNVIESGGLDEAKRVVSEINRCILYGCESPSDTNSSYSCKQCELYKLNICSSDQYELYEPFLKNNVQFRVLANRKDPKSLHFEPFNPQVFTLPLFAFEMAKKYKEGLFLYDTCALDLFLADCPQGMFADGAWEQFRKQTGDPVFTVCLKLMYTQWIRVSNAFQLAQVNVIPVCKELSTIDSALTFHLQQLEYLYTHGYTNVFKALYVFLLTSLECIGKLGLHTLSTAKLQTILLYD